MVEECNVIELSGNMSQIEGVNDLCGADVHRAECAKMQIATVFKNMTASNGTDCKEKQLKFATKVLYGIVQKDPTHSQFITDLICKDFANQLDPECNVAQWTYYLECVRYLFHKLATQVSYIRLEMII